MNKFKVRLTQMMQGRYGQDALGKLLIVFSFACLIISFFVIGTPLYMVALLFLGACYYRMFSRNIQKRYQENQKFLNIRYKLVCKVDRYKRRWRERKTHCFFKCSQCKQTIRVPKNKGQICITCPKCKHEFVTKT